MSCGFTEYLKCPQTVWEIWQFTFKQKLENDQYQPYQPRFFECVVCSLFTILPLNFPPLSSTPPWPALDTWFLMTYWFQSWYGVEYHSWGGEIKVSSRIHKLWKNTDIIQINHTDLSLTHTQCIRSIRLKQVTPNLTSIRMARISERATHKKCNVIGTNMSSMSKTMAK